MPIYTCRISTPLGTMIAGANDAGIYQLDFEHRRMMPRIRQRILRYSGETFEEGAHPLCRLLEQQLEAYFAGARQAFDLPLQLSGSPFQQKVWRSLLLIPYGETRTYGQQARVSGDVKAVRAVAAANGANTHAILIPCHRVIGANGALTGYAGGLQQKRWLLQHEQDNRREGRQPALF